MAQGESLNVLKETLQHHNMASNWKCSTEKWSPWPLTVDKRSGPVIV